MVVIRMRPGRHGRCQVVKSVRQDGTHKRLDELCFVDPRDGGECLARPRTLPLLARRCQSPEKLREGSEGRVWNAGGYYRSDPIAMPSARGASRKVAVVGIVMLRGVAAYN